MGRKVYVAQQFINAIPGTGGIISTIALKVGCDWHTAKKYIDTYSTIQQAYQDELESVADIAESLLVTNIRLGRDKQKETKERVDAADAKWYLARKTKRGYEPKQEIEHSGQSTIDHRHIIVYESDDDST